jgi:subtilase family serine protease
MKYIKNIVQGFFICMVILPASVSGKYRLSDFRARPPIHISGQVTALPRGMTPEQIRHAYHLPSTGGQGTIAIIDVGINDTIENDLAVFSNQFRLPPCTSGNGCFEQHVMGKTAADRGWGLETALDVEWAHAIAPNAKILLVEAATQSGSNLMSAIDYARERNDVVALSMSWGGAEFPTEASVDNHFTSSYGASFFAASGDQGNGVTWPAASANVISVGGTRLHITKNGAVSETAWKGSGGGISQYEPAPGYQTPYGIPHATGNRSVPDVSYNADMASGYAVYKGGAQAGWYVIGGTSGGAPQWAAIHSLGLSATNANFYRDKASSTGNKYFRDIKRGSNGTCGYYCKAHANYDYVTGLGSPLTIHF